MSFVEAAGCSVLDMLARLSLGVNRHISRRHHSARWSTPAASIAAAGWKTLPIKLISESLTIRRPISSLPIALSREFAFCAAPEADASGQGGP